MGTTPTYAWPYPEPTDPPQGALQMKLLSEGIESTLAGLADKLANPPVAQIAMTSNSQQFPSSTSLNVEFNTAVIDTHGGWGGSDTYTFKVAGIYVVSGTFTWGAEEDGYRQLKVAVNGDDVTGSEGSVLPILGTHVTPIATNPVPVRVSVGDTLTLIAWQSSGSTIAATSSISSQAEFRPTLNAYKIAD